MSPEGDERHAREVEQPVRQVSGGDGLGARQLDEHDPVDREGPERGHDRGHPAVGDEEAVDGAQDRADRDRDAR